MRAIRYAAPTSVEEGVALLARYGSRARVLAGGTDLIVQVRERLRDVDVFVDAKRIPELMRIAFDPAEGLTLGAAVPCCAIYEHPEVIRRYPGLVDAVSIIGGTAIQSRASVGGNLCNSGPAADSVPALIVYGAEAVIAGPGGRRSVPVESFCTAPGRNVLQPGEMLVCLRLPTPPPRSGARYLRFIPRNEMDIAEVGAAASVTLDEKGDRIVSARIALAAVAPTPLFVPEAGEALVGMPVEEEALSRAAEIARAAARPITDMRGTAEHRRHLVGVLTLRALRGAIDRARQA